MLQSNLEEKARQLKERKYNITNGTSDGNNYYNEFHKPSQVKTHYTNMLEPSVGSSSAGLNKKLMSSQASSIAKASS